jgi:hypothetical protein
MKRNINVSHYLQTMLRGGSQHDETVTFGIHLTPSVFWVPTTSQLQTWWLAMVADWMAGWLAVVAGWLSGATKEISSSAVE